MGVTSKNPVSFAGPLPNKIFAMPKIKITHFIKNKNRTNI